MNRLTLRVSLFAALALAVSCGGKSRSDTMPTLPGDGSEHTAKPKDGSAATEPDPWAGRTDLIESPAPQPPVALELPAIQRFTLKNGLEVMIVENHDLPVVSMQLMVKSGWQNEPRDKRGVADFTAQMLTKGTRARNAEKIAESIDFVGGQLAASATFEATFASCSVLSKDLRVCMELLPDVVVNPAFPDKEMQTVRDQLLTTVKSRQDDPGAMASVHFQNALWGEEHVRGWPMSKRSIENIARKDLQDWHRAWFKPDNAVLAIAGDVDGKKLQGELERAFRRWRKGKLPAQPSYEEPTVAGISVRIVDKEDATQTQIRLGHLGIAHTDPAFYATSVMNYTLGGGGFSSRLMKTVRSEGGKTYGAGSSFDTNLRRGAFVASTFTRNEEALNTVKLVIGELEKMQSQGPAQTEVVDAKANITGSYATRFDSADDFAGALLAADMHGFDAEYVRQFALRIGAVTAADAAKAAAEQLRPNNLVIVLVGPAKQLQPQLANTGWNVEVVPYSAPIARYEREALAEGSKGATDDAAVSEARKLLDAALAAKGGQKRLAAMKSLMIEGTAKLESPQVPGGKADASIKRIWSRPDKLRLDLGLQISQAGQTIDVDVVTIVAGDKGWVMQAVPAMNQRQVQELGGSELGDARQQMWRDSELILLRHKEQGTKVALAGEEKVDGSTYTPVVLTRADGNASVKLYINPKTKLLDRMSYVDGGEEALEVFEDYKPANGLEIARTRKSKGAQGRFDITVEKVEVNPKVDAAAFEKPQ